MADEKKEEPEAGAAGEQAADSQETAVGHPVVDDAAGRETAVGHPVVDEAAATEGSPAAEGTTEVFFSRPGTTPAAAPVPDPAPPQPAAAPPVGSGGTSPAAADRQAAESHDAFREKPELYLAGAFVGAFVFGKLLKRLTGSND